MNTRTSTLPVRNGLKTFADLFCGVGGFHLAAADLGLRCVFASEIDGPACDVYEDNFGLRPQGDITAVDAGQIPDHDVLLAGFPCQPFSIIGKRDGLADGRGRLFLEILRVLKAKRPRAVLLENVKQLATADQGRILNQILRSLEKLGYETDWRVLNALDFGLPQKRERILIVAGLDGLAGFSWPKQGRPMRPLSDILEKNPDPRHFASRRIREARRARQKELAFSPSVWHENKSGNISSHPYSCALRAGASYNYLLVNGERRLTPREMFRLQGFPDRFRLSASDAQARRQAGNAVPVPMVRAAMESLIHAS